MFKLIRQIPRLLNCFWEKIELSINDVILKFYFYVRNLSQENKRH